MAECLAEALKGSPESPSRPARTLRAPEAVEPPEGISGTREQDTHVIERMRGWWFRLAPARRTELILGGTFVTFGLAILVIYTLTMKNT